MGIKPRARRLNVLVTGCTDGGIGSALAAEFHRRGCRVFPTVRDPSRATHLAALGIVDDVVVLDVEDPTTISAAARRVRRLIQNSPSPSPSSSASSSSSSSSHPSSSDYSSSQVPPNSDSQKNDDDNSDDSDDDDSEEPALDILVNNAGIGYIATFLDSDLAAARRVLDVNFWGVVAVTQAFAPLLLAAGRRCKNNSSTAGIGESGDVEARIVNVGSILGELNTPYSGFYNASKAALRALSETMRVEMAPLGVSVTHMVVGVVTTKIIASCPVDFPPHSPYDSARAHMQEPMAGGPLVGAMKSPRAGADAFAHDLVARCLAPTRGGGGNSGSGEGRLGAVYWCGYLSWMSWVVARFVPTWVRDALVSRQAGLNRVRVPDRYEVDMG